MVLKRNTSTFIPKYCLYWPKNTFGFPPAIIALFPSSAFEIKSDTFGSDRPSSAVTDRCSLNWLRSNDCWPSMYLINHPRYRSKSSGVFASKPDNIANVSFKSFSVSLIRAGYHDEPRSDRSRAGSGPAGALPDSVWPRHNHLLIRPRHGDELADEWHLQFAVHLLVLFFVRMLRKPARESVDEREVCGHVLIFNERATHDDLRIKDQRHDVGAVFGSETREEITSRGRPAHRRYEDDSEVDPKHPRISRM